MITKQYKYIILLYKTYLMVNSTMLLPPVCTWKNEELRSVLYIIMNSYILQGEINSVVSIIKMVYIRNNCNML
jgi:hypothetical protein